MIVSRSDENFTACEKERKPGKHLVWEDQGAIEAMKGLGQSNQPLARYLNCSPATVSMEARMKPARADSKRFFLAEESKESCMWIASAKMHRAQRAILWNVL